MNPQVHAICERCYIDRFSTWEQLPGLPWKKLVGIQEPPRVRGVLIVRTCCFCFQVTIFGVFVTGDPKQTPCEGIHENYAARRPKPV